MQLKIVKQKHFWVIVNFLHKFIRVSLEVDKTLVDKEDAEGQKLP